MEKNCSLSQNKGSNDNDPVFTHEMFNKTLRLIRKKEGNKYDFVLKAGHVECTIQIVSSCME